MKYIITDEKIEAIKQALINDNVRVQTLIAVEKTLSEEKVETKEEKK